MARMWYYSSKSQQKGPVTWDELRGLAQAGQLRSSDLVWEEGTPDWVKSGQVNGLLDGAPVEGDEPGPRRRRREESDPDIRRRPRRREKSSSKGLVIGLIAGGALLLVIAVVVIIVVAVNSGSSKKGGGGGGDGPAPKVLGGLPVNRNVTAARGAGTRVEDSLNNRDTRDPGRRDAICKVYQVHMVPGKRYSIEMHSEVMDAYLRLVDSSAMEMASNDDWMGLNSRIDFLPAREDHYRIVCTSLSGGETGPFTLIVREE